MGFAVSDRQEGRERERRKMKSPTLTQHWAEKVSLGVDLQVILEVGLPEKDAVAVLVWTAKLFCVLVSLEVLREPVLTVEGLVTILQGKVVSFMFE